MSISARNWAWAMTYRPALDGETDPRGQPRPAEEPVKLKPGEKLTLLCLAEHENAEFGYAFPSHDRIAKATGQSVRTVQTHITTLLDLEIVEVQKVRGTRGPWLRNVYVLAVPDSYRDNDPEWLRHN